MSFSRRALLSLFIVASIAACTKRSGPAAKFGQGPIIVAPATPEASALEHQMHARLNRDRAKKGLPPLAYDEKLADVGRAHSKDMNEANFFAHDSPRTGTLEDRLDRAGVLVLAARENLGEGPGVDGTQDALLASPGHYANIMADDVTHVGIGILNVGSKTEERLLVTQVFSTPAPEQSPGNARGAMLQRIMQARQKAGLGPLPSHPKLETLAKKYVDEIGDDLGDATDAIGDKVTKELVGSDLNGVVVGANAFIAVDLYNAEGSAVSGRAKAIGIATTKGTDARGRPAIKALVLIGL
jgi:uncharacterized protein YkwD